MCWQRGMQEAVGYKWRRENDGEDDGCQPARIYVSCVVFQFKCVPRRSDLSMRGIQQAWVQVIMAVGGRDLAMVQCDLRWHLLEVGKGYFAVKQLLMK